jgi:hypothetical protein
MMMTRQYRSDAGMSRITGHSIPSAAICISPTRVLTAKRTAELPKLELDVPPHFLFLTDGMLPWDKMSAEILLRATLWYRAPVTPN